MTHPATLWGFPRVVDGSRGKCWAPKCLTITGTWYGPRRVCSRCSLEQAAIERVAEQYAKPQAVAR